MTYAEKFVRHHHKDARIETICINGIARYAVYVGRCTRQGRHCSTVERAWASAAKAMGYKGD